MAENENSKDLLSVLWAGADILRGKMDANEYKNYLLGIVFYKYLSDSFLTHVYDLLNNKEPENMTVCPESIRRSFFYRGRRGTSRGHQGKLSLYDRPRTYIHQNCGGGEQQRIPARNAAKGVQQRSAVRQHICKPFCRR